MRKSHLIFVLPAFACFALVGCSDDGNLVPERGVAKKYVADYPDLVAAQKAADEDAEKENE